MKVVILAGGKGTRISEESILKPKPMIEIGGMPIIWHIMKIYSRFGFNDFIICGGYKQEIIKDWFANYFLHSADITFDYTQNRNEIIINQVNIEPWRVTVVDTGLETQTGGRVKRIKNYIDDDVFMLTYGDAVSDIDISKILNQHKESKKIGTVSLYNYGQSKGVVKLSNSGIIEQFREKSDQDNELINIGFMVFDSKVFDYLYDDSTNFEKNTLTYLADNNELAGYIHKGFWQCMDTLKEKEQLEKMWKDNRAPWKIWED